MSAKALKTIINGYSLLKFRQLQVITSSKFKVHDLFQNNYKNKMDIWKYGWNKIDNFIKKIY